MKTIIFYLGILLAFILLSVSSNAKVQVNLKVNEELIYEWKSAQLFPPSSNTAFPRERSTIRYSLSINKCDSVKIAFTARILHDIYDVSGSAITDFRDFGFPQLIKYYQVNDFNDILKEILYRIPFKFELDLNSRNIALINRDEIMDQCLTLISSRQYAVQTKEEAINLLDKTVIQNRADFFLQPFLFIKTDINQQNISLSKGGLNF